jgi:hypothetical protein
VKTAAQAPLSGDPQTNVRHTAKSCCVPTQYMSADLQNLGMAAPVPVHMEHMFIYATLRQAILIGADPHYCLCNSGL